MSQFLLPLPRRAPRASDAAIMQKIAKNISRIFVLSSCLLFIGCSGVPSGTNRSSAFKEIQVDYRHKWTEETHPFSGAGVIDIDNDGRMEVFVGGSQGQSDALLGFQDGKLVDLIEGTGLSHQSATYGPVSIDVDGDGDTDLLVAREDGIYLYQNQAGRFIENSLPIVLAEDAVPLNVAVSDIDQDGDGDIYISVFVKFNAFRSGVFNDPTHAKTNILLMNNGDQTFTDITAASGTAGLQNTFLSVFVDLNRDGYQDLVLAQNTGEIEVFRNNGDRTFTAVPTNSGFGFWMGLAVGDIDNDGDQDLFFSNAGNSIPAFLTKGDIRDDQKHNLEWLLLRNDGDFVLTDVTAAYSLTGEGFAWGGVFEDINLDSRLDLLVAQNYLKWPIHRLFKLPGKTYLQIRSNEQGKFQHVKTLGLENPHFGQSPVIVDLNEDGRPDVLWLNMNGTVRAFLNTSDNNFITVSVPDSVAMLGTRVSIETASKQVYTREIVTSTGMLTDQTSELVFGLGTASRVERILLEFPGGETRIIESPAINTKIRVH